MNQRYRECPGWKAGLYMSFPHLMKGSIKNRTTIIILIQVGEFPFFPVFHKFCFDRIITAFQPGHSNR
jgi:hypothetical protein